MWLADVDVISVWGIEFDFISVQGSELTGFCVEIEKDMILVYGLISSWVL